MSIFFGAIFK